LWSDRQTAFAAASPVVSKAWNIKPPDGNRDASRSIPETIQGFPVSVFFLQLRVWIWNAIVPLMKPAMIVPGKELGQGSLEMPSVHDDHMVKVLAA
jgi:hypothetical protein